MLEEFFEVRVVAGPEDDEVPFMELARDIVCSVVIWAEGCAVWVQ